MPAESDQDEGLTTNYCIPRLDCWRMRYVDPLVGTFGYLQDPLKSRVIRCCCSLDLQSRRILHHVLSTFSTSTQYSSVVPGVCEWFIIIIIISSTSNSSSSWQKLATQAGIGKDEHRGFRLRDWLSFPVFFVLAVDNICQQSKEYFSNMTHALMTATDWILESRPLGGMDWFGTEPKSEQIEMDMWMRFRGMRKRRRILRT